MKDQSGNSTKFGESTVVELLYLFFYLYDPKRDLY